MSPQHRSEEPTLKVSRLPNGEPEIFRSLQGEGPSLGTPSIFLRLATCNLACTWCDTKYTWDWRNYDYNKEAVELPVEIVEERVLGHKLPHLIITGGEPLLQREGLAPLVQSLKSEGFAFEVETNGTILPGPGLEQYIDQWNVSPKLATSGNSAQHREISEALEYYGEQGNAFFKFVITEPLDLEEVRRLVEKYKISRERVQLMPEGRTPQTLLDRGQWLSALCIQEGFRFSPRLHILLWGDKRGT